MLRIALSRRESVSKKQAGRKGQFDGTLTTKRLMGTMANSRLRRKREASNTIIQDTAKARRHEDISSIKNVTLERWTVSEIRRDWYMVHSICAPSFPFLAFAQNPYQPITKAKILCFRYHCHI